MIEARPSRWFGWWFRRWLRRSLRRTFAVGWIAGRDELPSDARSLLCVANHSSWWDGPLAALLSADVLQRDGFALMDADQLRRYRFFAKLGAFGVQSGSRRDGAAALRYAAQRLRVSGRALWIFPQGAETPAHVPLRFRPGASRVASLAGAQVGVLPVGMRLVMGSRPRPELYVAFGRVLEAATATMIDPMRDAVAQQLQRIDAQLERPDRAFTPWFGDPTDREDAAARWLDALVGPSTGIAAAADPAPTSDPRAAVSRARRGHETTVA